MIRGLPGSLAAAAVLAAPMAAGAHHSFTMFDSDKTINVSGVVKSYSFRMPHVWIFVLVPMGGGGTEEWGCEMSSPNLAVRKGWNIDSLKPGDKVTVAMHPMRDGAKAGSVVSVTLPDGAVLMN
jgi:hypothetical protein